MGRIAALVPEFAVKDLPLGRNLMMVYFKTPDSERNVIEIKRSSSPAR